MEIVLFESTVRPKSVLSKSTLRTRAGALRTLVRGMEFVLFESTVQVDLQPYATIGIYFSTI